MIHTHAQINSYTQTIYLSHSHSHTHINPHSIHKTYIHTTDKFPNKLAHYPDPLPPPSHNQKVTHTQTNMSTQNLSSSFKHTHTKLIQTHGE